MIGRRRLGERFWRLAVRLGRDYSSDWLSSRLVVFAPHPDDETLGCGGLVLRKRGAGAPVTIVFMTDGSRSHARHMAPDELATLREQEARAACRRLGIADDCIVFCRYPDATLNRHSDEATERVRTVLQRLSPHEVAIPYRHDVTSDHLATRRIVRAAVRSSGLTVRVLEYPVWFWHAWPWVPVPYNGRRQVVRDTVGSAVALVRLMAQLRCQLPIDQQWSAKRTALEEHRSQVVRLRPDTPWPTLHDVASGEFIDCFFRSHERFMSYTYGHVSSSTGPAR